MPVYKAQVYTRSADQPTLGVASRRVGEPWTARSVRAQSITREPVSIVRAVTNYHDLELVMTRQLAVSRQFGNCKPRRPVNLDRGVLCDFR